MQIYHNLLEEDDINPEEDAALRSTVASTTVTCVRTAIQTAVTTAYVALGQDWSQEGRRLVREFNLVSCEAVPMRASDSRSF